MRIVCLTENLSQGGAERQIVMLARLLKEREHDVSMLLYHPADHYRHLIDAAGIPVTVISTMGKFRRALSIRKAIRAADPEMVIAFKASPSFHAELAGLPLRRWGLIVSERNHDYLGPSRDSRRRMLFHRLADAVVSNSQAQLDFMKTHAPFLLDKVRVISNCIDLAFFHPKWSEGSSSGLSPQLRLLVLARVWYQKNPLRFCQAVVDARNRYDIDVVVDWYGTNFYIDGRPGAQSSCFEEMREFIAANQVENVIRWHDATQEVRPLLWNCDALVLPSLYEGFPNVIGEAIACGKPVLASLVGDNNLMVEDRVNGFIFDPLDINDIARAIRNFNDLSSEEREAMGRESRKKAEEVLSEERFIAEYEGLAREVLAQK